MIFQTIWWRSKDKISRRLTQSGLPESVDWIISLSNRKYNIYLNIIFASMWTKWNNYLFISSPLTIPSCGWYLRSPFRSFTTKLIILVYSRARVWYVFCAIVRQDNEIFIHKLTSFKTHTAKFSTTLRVIQNTKNPQN